MKTLKASFGEVLASLWFPLKRKNAQMKIQQMAFMLIAITLFFVLVGLVVLVIYLSGLKGSATIIEENNALTLAMKIANSPEFSCGESLGGLKLTCIDGDKLMMLKKDLDKYKDAGVVRGENFWGVDTNIEIRKIYPMQNEGECTLGNYPDCSVINLFSKPLTSEYSNFVLLCYKANSDDEVYNKCDIAKIMVSYKKWE